MRIRTLAFLFLLAAGLAAQEDVREQVAAEERARAEALRQDRERREAEAGALARAEARRAERDRLAEDVKAARAEVSRLEAELDARREAARWDAAAVKEIAAAWADRIDAGIPYRRAQRAARMRAAAEDPARFWEAAAEELRLARSREVESRVVTLADGREAHAHVLRLGLVREICVTEDGAHAGVAGREWSWVSDESARERLREAIRIAKERGTPRLLLLPFPEAR